MTPTLNNIIKAFKFQARKYSKLSQKYCLINIVGQQDQRYK